MARYVRPVYSVADVFAAAAAAHRMNGSYLKSDDITFHDDGGHTVNKIANKTLVHQFLKGDLGMTLEDHEMGDKVMQYCRSLTFKLLSDKRLSDFEATMLSIVEKSTTDSNYDIAVVASLPASYERSLVRAEQNVRLREASGCIDAEVGSKIRIKGKVKRHKEDRTQLSHVKLI